MSVMSKPRIALSAFAAILGAVVILQGMAGADDWPRWRGVNGDGISAEAGWDVSAFKGQMKPLWTQNVSSGYSAASVVGDKLYTMGNQDGKDYIGCLDVEKGTVLWSYSYDCKGGDYPGPRATPAVDGDRLYTFSNRGDLVCLTTGGEKVWKLNVGERAGAKNITWGYSGSPLVVGDLVVVNAGTSGAAFNKETGADAWKSPAGQGGYATPVAYELDGVKCIAIFSKSAVCGVEAATGKMLWSYPWETRHNVNAPDPIIFDHYVFVTSGYGRGCGLIDIAGNKAKKVWENNEIAAHFSSCVYIDGYIYGIDGNTGKGKLKCIDAMTGNRKWEHDTGFGALIAVDGKLIVQNERGSVFVAAVDPAGYKELAKGMTFDPKRSHIWTAPVLANGRYYVRADDGNVACFPVTK
jgi:hypothetical protein